MKDLPSNEEIINRIESKATKKAGDAVLLYFIKNFSNEGYVADSTFVRWKDRKDTKNKKPLLYDTGDMKKSFHLELGKGFFMISNTKEYSKYHQSGTEHMPKRQMLYTDKNIDKIIEDAVIAEFDKLFKK